MLCALPNFPPRALLTFRIGHPSWGLAWSFERPSWRNLRAQQLSWMLEVWFKIFGGLVTTLGTALQNVYGNLSLVSSLDSFGLSKTYWDFTTAVSRNPQHGTLRRLVLECFRTRQWSVICNGTFAASHAGTPEDLKTTSHHINKHIISTTIMKHTHRSIPLSLTI